MWKGVPDHCLLDCRMFEVDRIVRCPNFHMITGGKRLRSISKHLEMMYEERSAVYLPSNIGQELHGCRDQACYEE